jgi:hypothetical protein
MATKVYKVLNTETGLYRTAGGGFNKRGKTWESLGLLRNSLNSQGYTREYGEEWIAPLPDDNVQIVEIIVEETPGNTRSLREFIEQERRFKLLAQKYGDGFRGLVEKIEKDGQQDDWQWVLLIPYTRVFGEFAGMLQEVDQVLEIIKDLKLKLNKDYRKSGRSGGMAVAFRDKRLAMQVRLRASCPSMISMDIKNFVEANLDTEEPVS